MKYPSPFARLHFGTSGIPFEVKDRGYFAAIKLLRESGLSAMEMEFVQQVHMTEESGEEFGRSAKKLGVLLSSHAPYYINLASLEKQKIHASISRIVRASKVTSSAKGHSVVFHAGYYQGRKQDSVFSLVAKGITRIEKELEKERISIWLRPEITGKETQFGNLDELIRLSCEFESVLPCVDFSHLHARSQGRFNTEEEWREVLHRLKEETPKEKQILKRMHIHLSGIEYGAKGERRHLPLEKSDLEFPMLLQVLADSGVRGTLICESPAEVLLSNTKTLRDTYALFTPVTKRSSSAPTRASKHSVN